MAYEAKPLPFRKQLIGISEKTMQIHHDKLYVGYVNKRNEIDEKLTKVDRTAANATYSEYGELKREESFAANAIYLHEYYFNVLGGENEEGTKPTGDLIQAIEKEFGSYEKWLEDFKAAGLCARGWVVLAYDFNTGKLHNYLCDSHNHGGIWGAMPVVVLDMYEHAFFIDYGSDRKAYIEDYMKNLNWEAANHLYGTIKK
ncbi:superoxide dismutase [Candidatus Peregrinibacteria bacterium]|nr:superoxide dismutase [Candidatus Peregrinibacteria bacterium]